MSQLAYITRFQFTDFLGSSIIRYGAESNEGFSGSDVAKATMAGSRMNFMGTFRL